MSEATYDTGLVAQAINTDTDVDLHQEDQDIDSTMEFVNDAVVANEQLATLAKLVKTAEARGGMSPALAQMTAFTHECIVSNLGFTTKGKKPTIKKVVTSLESFKDTDKRAYQTALTLEEIESNKEAISAKIKKMIQAIIERIKTFFSKVMSLVSGAETNFNKAIEMANKAKRDSSDEQINASAVAQEGLEPGYKSAQAVIDTCQKVVNAFPSIIKQMEDRASDGAWSNSTLEVLDGLYDNLPNRGDVNGYFTRGRCISAEVMEFAEKPATGDTSAKPLTKQQIIDISKSGLTMLKSVNDVKKKMLRLTEVMGYHARLYGHADAPEIISVMASAIGWTAQKMPNLVITSLRDVSMFAVASARTLQTADE